MPCGCARWSWTSTAVPSRPPAPVAAERYPHRPVVGYLPPEGREACVMHCASCGTELPDSAKFCFNCGQTVAASTCASCCQELVPGARFCMNCGAAVENAEPTEKQQGRVSSRRVTSILFGDLV